MPSRRPESNTSPRGANAGTLVVAGPSSGGAGSPPACASAAAPFRAETCPLESSTDRAKMAEAVGSTSGRLASRAAERVALRGSDPEYTNVDHVRPRKSCAPARPSLRPRSRLGDGAAGLADGRLGGTAGGCGGSKPCRALSSHACQR